MNSSYLKNYRQSLLLLKSWNLYPQFSRFSMLIKRFYYQESLPKNQKLHIRRIQNIFQVTFRKNSPMLPVRRQSHRSFTD